MSDEATPPTTRDGVPLVVAQEMCDHHQDVLFDCCLNVDTDHERIMCVVMGRTLCTLLMANDARVRARTAGDAHTLSLVLAEFGPSCCAIGGVGWACVLHVMMQGPEHTGAVIYSGAADPAFTRWVELLTSGVTP